MNVAEPHELAEGLVGAAGPQSQPRAVTFGPGEEDWAVIDSLGRVAYVGPALFAARLATSGDLD